MKIFFKIVYSILICIIVFSAWKSFRTLYGIKYDDFSKNAIQDFMLSNNIKLKNSKGVTNVTMEQIIPSGYAYTIYYIDIDNKKQSEQISRKSEITFRDYMFSCGENISERYHNICMTTFYILIFIVVIKSIIIFIHNKK